MKIPPLWKFKRELLRIRDQALRALHTLCAEPLQQWWFDRHVDQHQRCTPGDQPLTLRVAVLVLFQPRGLAASVRLTLDHLVSQNWATLVVSNAPLSDHDAAWLRSRSALLVERPNVGYDFGAYRAGLRVLAQMGHQPQQLILMNDSTWLPLRATDDTLQRMEAMSVDMAGHIFKTEGKRSRDHMESHLLLFSQRALAHPSWTGFWQRFVMSSDRVNTIIRGEKGLSQALISGGLHVRGLIDRETLLAQLTELTDDKLRQTMNDVVHHRSDAQRQYKDMALSKTWRVSFLEWVNVELLNSRHHLVSSTFVASAMQLCHLGFVKKTSDVRFHLARCKLLELEAQRCIAPFHPDVRAEMAAAVAQWQAPPTH